METTITEVSVFTYVRRFPGKRLLVVKGKVSPACFPFWVEVEAIGPDSSTQTGMYITYPINGGWEAGFDIPQDGIYTISAQCSLTPFIPVHLGEPDTAEFDTTGQ